MALKILLALTLAALACGSPVSGQTGAPGLLSLEQNVPSLQNLQQNLPSLDSLRQSFPSMPNMQNLGQNLPNMQDFRQNLPNIPNMQSLPRLPGSQYMNDFGAATADGISRYFAPDGPIQPAITAVGGLPMRGAEMLNQGITQISSGANTMARRMAQSGSRNGQIAMPGMDSIRSNMPGPLAAIGDVMQDTIRGKNNFIRGQAESAVQSGERQRQSIQQGLRQ